MTVVCMERVCAGDPKRARGHELDKATVGDEDGEDVNDTGNTEIMATPTTHKSEI